MSSKLLIAVDPGFDSIKVVANGKLFQFPFNVVETNERLMTDYKLRDDFLLYQDEAGANYRVGQYARELLFDRKISIDDFYTERRFITREFQVGIDTAVALAIEKCGCSHSLHDVDIYLMVALPHACRSQYASSIIGQTTGRHSFQLRRGQTASSKFSFFIPEGHVFTVSQTIAAILGETSSDKGEVDEQKFFYLSNGPTLVLDGGYYTMGMVVVSRGGSVDESKTESDTRHAMSNVNQLVIDSIKDKRNDLNHYAVEYLINKDNGQLRFFADGQAQIIDLRSIREEKIKEVCMSLIDYLNQKYNYLLDFKYLLITGGTGACFYPHILEYYSGAKLMDKDHLLLTSAGLQGQKIPIQYAISAGAYKGLRGKLGI